MMITCKHLLATVAVAVALTVTAAAAQTSRSIPPSINDA